VKEDINSMTRRIRVFTGLVLFIYTSTHLLNHSVATISIQAADAVREYFLLAWRNPVAEIILFLSIAVHIILGILAVIRKRSAKMTKVEWVQILFPFIALFVLLQHIVTAALLSRIFGVDDSYELIFAGTLANPDTAFTYGLFYTLMIVMIWTHGIIGIRGLIRFKPFYKTYHKSIVTFFWAVPILSVTGFLSGLKEMSFLSYANSLVSKDNYLFGILMKAIPQEAFPVLGQIEVLTSRYYPLFFLAVAGLAALNVIRASYFGQVTVTYPNGETVRVAAGTTLLESSRIGKIPHQSVCGGKGRCTTCRVRILAHDKPLPAPNMHEAKAIERVGLDEGLRLACQLRVDGDISVAPLLQPANQMEGVSSARALTGKEQETVILFVDVREFTKLAETKLPYDVVYILNKYYAACGAIIEENHGRLDKFIGDGIMAIFDGADSPAENCSNAVRTASLISDRMEKLNSEMKIDFDDEIRFGMGIHAGQAIVGMMGYGRTVSETAVGDNVNVASRLEELSKKYKCQLVISKYVAELAKIDTRAFSKDKVKIRGRREKLDILFIENAAQIVA
jgi:adenylate cyclase